MIRFHDHRVDSLLSDTTHISFIVDSLKHSVLNAQNDTMQISFLNELTQNWRGLPNKIFATEAIHYCTLINYSTGLCDAQARLAIYHLRSGEFEKADSLLNISIKSSATLNNKTLLAQALFFKGECFRVSNKADSTLSCYIKALDIAEKKNLKKRQAICLNAIADYYRNSKSDTSLLLLKRAVRISEAEKDYNTLSYAQGLIARIYTSREMYDSSNMILKKSIEGAIKCGNNYFASHQLLQLGDNLRLNSYFPEALNAYFHALKLIESSAIKSEVPLLLSGIAEVYRFTPDYDKAIEYNLKAIDEARSLKQVRVESFALANLGEIYKHKNEIEKALRYYFAALEVAQANGFVDREAFCLSVIGAAYRVKGDEKNTKEFILKAIRLNDELKDNNHVSFCYMILGKLYKQKNNPVEAQKYLEKALDHAKQSGIIQNICDISYELYQLYEGNNNPAKALKMHLLYVSTKDSIVNEGQIKNVAEAEYKLKEDNLITVQGEKERIFRIEKELKEEELKRQKIIRYAFTTGFILVLILAFVIYRNLVDNRKKNKIISLQKAEVEKQKHLIEERQKEVMDSITYAKRLQDAILPSRAQLSANLPEAFLLYLPKDIVAGDFYWTHEIKNSGTESGNARLILVAAADCTGHGVPGAMVSVVCSNALNRAVIEFGITNPGKILDKTCELVVETFEKSGEDVKDGMDISLALINTETREIKWSGANNPLWYLSHNEIHEITADKQPIGKSDYSRPFTTHTIQLKKGDSVYLFTDGFADQFGGPIGKKFKYKPLKELLLAIASLTPEEQKQKLEFAFNEWKGNLEQVDDVSMVGVRV